PPHLFDWALDKGTTDGLLYGGSGPADGAGGDAAGVARARAAWSLVSRYTDTLVWVSLGNPGARVPLIEDQLGGGAAGGDWRVRRCLEVAVPLAAGASGMPEAAAAAAGAAGAIDRCWIYVCTFNPRRRDNGTPVSP
ncbi:hypothetical protein HK405_002709, partial [Cladochytrium tenue]